MRMETTLFLGAGASVFAGMPTTGKLIGDVLGRVLHQESWENPTAASLARNIVRDHEGKDVEVLYQTIRRMVDAEKLHGEAMEYKMAGDNNPAWKREILTASRFHPDTKTTKDETEDIAENIRALESLEVAIRNTLLDRLMVKPDHFKDVAERYGELFRETESHTIITTNYDNVLEVYCEEVGLGIINGFRASSLGNRRIWDPDTWDDSEYDVDHGGDSPDDYYATLARMRLVKLHGSITWQEEDDGTVLEIGSIGPRNTKKDVMILPTLGEKDYSRSIFPELWRQFEKVLAGTELLIVIGFSFRDPQINQVLLNRLKRTTKNPMKLLYIDLKHEGLKELVGADVEPHPIKADRGTLWHYHHDEMPHVYAHNAEFPLRPNKLKFVLEILDAVSDKTPPSRD